MSFKNHPEETLVAESPDGVPSPLNLDDSGNLKVVGISPPTPPPTPLPINPSGDVLVDSPTLTSLFQELITEVRKSNIYLSLLVGEEILDSDVEV